MSDTPFIDVLSDEQLAIVARKTRGESRPSFYDASVAQAGNVTGVASDGRVQISLDLEAVLILAPTTVKKEILSFITTAGEITSRMNADDFQLMSEVVLIRRNSYTQIARDIGEKVLEFDTASAKLKTFVENTARSNATVEQTNPDTAAVTAVILPDLGVFFSSLADAYSVLSKPDDLAVHDRIADAGILYTVQNAASERVSELSSWAAVFQTYLA